MRSITARILFLALILPALVFAAQSPAAADEMCTEHTPVTIDIKPGSDVNKINLSSRGLLPVAILSTDGFDASLFNLEAAHLSDAATAEGCAGAAAVRWNVQDVNADGRLDLILFFNIRDLNFTADTTTAMLMAHGVYGGAIIHVMGTDAVQVIQ